MVFKTKSMLQSLPETPGLRRSMALLLLLAACAPSPSGPVSDPQDYAITEAPVPFAVRQLLPRGVVDRDVRVADNCYGYVFQGRIYPVLNPRGTQYCI